MVKKIGISLPNDFNNIISSDILKFIDVIEVPYNKDNQWIIDSISEYKKNNVEIILRSLFLQGREDKSLYYTILEQALNLETSLVIGMTAKEQIDENTSIIKRRLK